MCTDNGTSIGLYPADSESLIYFDADGNKACLTLENARQFREMNGMSQIEGNFTTSGTQIKLIFIPIKISNEGGLVNGPTYLSASGSGTILKSLAPMGSPNSGISSGIVGVGKSEGNFQGTRNLPIERDERYPITMNIIDHLLFTGKNDCNCEFVEHVSEAMSALHKICLEYGSLVISNTNRITESNITASVEPTWFNGWWGLNQTFYELDRSSMLKVLQPISSLDKQTALIVIEDFLRKKSIIKNEVVIESMDMLKS